ncbi:hypothetical protein [Sorangium sp. So ce1389]|uniref:hypothetical protein n=1 Tax=Sorangium sp. So ce1389 TaxID=3133336 RepID=UPI003F5FEFA4
MMDALLVAAFGASSIAAAVAGMAVGASKARRRAVAELGPRLDRANRELRLAERRAEDVERLRRLDAERLRATALAPDLCEPAAPVYPGRPSPRELDGIAARLRGFAFVDAVAVADAAGLCLSRGEDARARSLAALVPLVKRLEGAGDGALEEVVEVALVTQDARQVALRRLPAWTGGAWLATLSTSQPPSPLALDAAIAGAVLARPGEPASRSGARSRSEVRWSGTLLSGHTASVGAERGANTRQLLAEIERLAAATSARAVGLGQGGRLLGAVFRDGPAEPLFAAVLGAVDALRAGAARVLAVGDVARIELLLADGASLAFAPMQPRSRFALLTVTEARALDPLEIDRFVGRIRRLVPPLEHAERAPLSAAGGAP